MLGKQAYFLLAAAGALVVFALYLFIPVWFIPANSVAFELAQASAAQYLLLAVLAALTGMIVALEVFSFRRSRGVKVSAAGGSGAGLVASLAGGVLAAGSCGCGTGILLGILGLGGGTLFVVANQTAIVLVMLVAVAIGFYFSARRAAGVCATCRV